MLFTNRSEKKLFALTIGSAAIVVAKKSEENDKNNKETPFAPKRLQGKNDDGLDSISNNDVRLSLHLDNPSGEMESLILLKNSKEDFDDGQMTAFLSDLPADGSSDLGILVTRRLKAPKAPKAPKSTKAPKEGNIFPPTPKASKQSVPLPTSADMQDLVPCAVKANYSPSDVTCSGELVFGPMVDWDVSEVESFQQAFQSACNELDEDINWPSLNKIIKKWDLSGANNIAFVFDDCKFGENAPDLSKWDVSGVTDFEFAFADSDFNDIGVASWKPSSAEDMNSMFYRNKQFNQDISSWATYLPANAIIDYMFYGAKKFNQCLDSWAGTSVLANSYTFKKTACPNKDETYFCCETVP